MVEPAPLSLALREQPSAVFAADACTGFVDDLVAGRCARADYIALVAQHWYVYAELEAAAERMRRDPVASVFISDRLTRLPAIEADLAFLVGAHWRERITALPGTRRYVQRIRTVGTAWAGGFVAHHYTRYLGDLSGGPTLGRLLQRRLGFDTNGIGFYLFGDIADPAAFKAVYREQLDAAPWDDAERERVIAEVLVAYRCNLDLFAALGGGAAASVVA